MFENIGVSIKVVAKVLFCLGIILSIVAAIFALKYLSADSLMAIFIMLIGFLVSWFSTFLLYGFGELVDNSTRINRKLTILLDNDSYDDDPKEKTVSIL